MKFFLIIAALVVVVLLCEKYKAHLPTPIRQLYALWEKFAKVLGLVMSTIILTIFWTIGIGAYAIVMKLFRPFTKKKTSDGSFWIPSDPHPVEHMSRQF